MFLRFHKKRLVFRELQNGKEFEKSSEFVPFTSYAAGASSLHAFQEIIDTSNEIEILKAAGLTNDDIRLFLDSKRGDDYLNQTHRNFEKSLLQERMKTIKSMIEKYCNKQERKEAERNSVAGRHKSEFALSVKPDSTETKLLQFALNSRKQDDCHFPHPMDFVKEIEQARFGSIETLPIKKIRKKARNLSHQIARIENSTESNYRLKNNSKEISYTNDTKWDLKQDISSESNIKVVKQYTCKPQRLYTIENGVIIEINSPNQSLNNINFERISIEEIKKDSKFANYDEGEPSKTLYLKNLHKKTTQKDLRVLVSRFTNANFDVKSLSGKMNGQAFITFEGK